ncbi:sigma factor [Terrimonas ginsenosidimutans]|uniref:sigma factor n=1 Tax=Terrimonas ginsenosidimutans TaxID=2908004 RepID=UPI003D7BF488
MRPVCLCHMAGGDSHRAEDLVEEVFIKVLQRNPLKSRVEDWRSFLYMSVRNTCFKHIRNTRPLQLLAVELHYMQEGIDKESSMWKPTVRRWMRSPSYRKNAAR